MQESLAQQCLKELWEHLKEGLLRWKQFRIYVSTKKFRTNIVQEEHDVPMAVHCGK